MVNFGELIPINSSIEQKLGHLSLKTLSFSIYCDTKSIIPSKIITTPSSKIVPLTLKLVII